MEHTLALQNICRKSVKKSLDKVQNEAVKFISGGMKSSPIAACEIDSNIEPLSLRRESAAIEMVERYRRSDKDNPYRGIVDRWNLNDQITQMSILKVERRLQEKHHMPENREPEISLSKEMPPNKTILTPVINLELVENVSKKHTDPVELNLIGIRTILAYPEQSVLVYTDGSADKRTINAGFGARIEYTDRSCDEISEPCGDCCSNYEAEALAISESIKTISKTLKKTLPRLNDVSFSQTHSLVLKL